MREAKDKLDFIVIGAQKAGTTSLFEHLKLHPEIALPRSKEAPFFSHDRGTPTPYTSGWTAYMERLIAESTSDDPRRKWGTISTHYMVGTIFKPARGRRARRGYDERTIPARIYQQLPNVRLIAILRDPVERAISHHRMEVSRSRETRSFDNAVRRLLRPGSLERARRNPDPTNGYVVWGEYGRILAGYLDVFPREQILVVFTRELEQSPAQLLARVQDFIGVRTDFEPDNLSERHRPRMTTLGFSWLQPSSWMMPTSPLSPHAARRVLVRNPAARALWHAMPDQGKMRLWRAYERRAKRTDALSTQRASGAAARHAPEPSMSTLTRLREHYAPDGERLAELIGETPPWEIQPVLASNVGANSAQRGAGAARRHLSIR